jgi:hypothetical protein
MSGGDLPQLRTNPCGAKIHPQRPYQYILQPLAHFYPAVCRLVSCPFLGAAVSFASAIRRGEPYVLVVQTSPLHVQPRRLHHMAW